MKSKPRRDKTMSPQPKDLTGCIVPSGVIAADAMAREDRLRKD
jgi:uncharacterized membrane-anchored protein